MSSSVNVYPSAYIFNNNVPKKPVHEHERKTASISIRRVVGWLALAAAAVAGLRLRCGVVVDSWWLVGWWVLGRCGWYLATLEGDHKNHKNHKICDLDFVICDFVSQSCERTIQE